MFFFILNISSAQNKKEITDEQYTILRDKIRLHFNATSDSALFYARQMAKSQNYKHLAFANGAMSSLYQMIGKPKESQEKYKAALGYIEKMPDSKDKTQLKAIVYNYGGLADRGRGDYRSALEKFHQSIKYASQIQDLNHLLKVKGNIALVNEAVGNYQLAVKNNKEIISFISKNENLFSKADVLNRRSNTYMGIASAYESDFMNNKKQRTLLDSAQYYYKKAISYSDPFPYNVTNSKLSLGNIYLWKKDLKNGEKTYLEVAALAQKNNFKDLLCTTFYNLADVYRSTGKFNKALLFYKKCDSLALLTHLNESDYLLSNCYQARIYAELNKPGLAHKHSEIYLKHYEKFEEKLRKETAEVNYIQGIDSLTQEMMSIEGNYKSNLFFDGFLSVMCLLLFAILFFLLVKNISEKNTTYKKMNSLIEEFKAEIERKKNPCIAKPEDTSKRQGVKLNIKETEENRIVDELLALEKKLEYLNTDFTLSYTAKKIKTNTTYLSYVVNKRFGKSFGEYSNELKINYVINELITNQSYRKYSTQAAAESAGFKNADSFAKSFRKRTGVSPAQFANNI